MALASDINDLTTCFTCCIIVGPFYGFKLAVVLAQIVRDERSKEENALAIDRQSKDDLAE